MRSLPTLIAGAVLSVPALAAVPAVAAVPAAVPVSIVAHTSFSTDAAAFESSLDGCESGEAFNDAVFVTGTHWGGVFNGTKVFVCDDGESGFAVRLKARFGADGSSGSWNVIDAWGALEGLKGSGSLVGIPTDSGIDDIYTGSVR